MIAGLLVAPQPMTNGGTQPGSVVAQGIVQGAAAGQLSATDQENILGAAANTPAGAALLTRNFLAVGAVALLGGIAAGYFLKRRR